MRLSFNLSHKAKIQNPVFENEPSEISALSAKKCKRTGFWFFFFLHSISSKITVVKEKEGKKRKSEKEKRRRTEYINLWLNS